MKTRTLRQRHSKRERGAPVRSGFHLVILGLGNIGSKLVPLLARMSGVRKLTLLDCDRYENRNLASQQIVAADVGKPKALVQARVARRLNPNLEVVAVTGRLEDVPRGWLRGNVILACLDSKAARRDTNEIAWRLAVPLIDAGIEASGMLARITVYRPGAGQPCLECGWDERDYAQLPVKHPCDAGGNGAAPTNAPASLGALTAALQAIECEKILRSEPAAPMKGKELIIEAASHKQYLSALRHNPHCRFDHASWAISKRRAPASATIGAALKLAGGSSEAGLGFGGLQLVRRLDCPRCGFSRRGMRLRQRLSEREKTCAGCGRELLTAGFFTQTCLNPGELDAPTCERSLASLGLRQGDIISVGRGQQEVFLQLTAKTERRGSRRPLVDWRVP